MILRNVQLPTLSSYAAVSRIQDKLVANLLAHKASPATVAPPAPSVITAEFKPVYTCGRREIGTLNEETKAFLRNHGKADFYEALRGGQTTFHGPGQLVAYPILDLRRHNLTPRSYVCLLEKAVIRTCARYGVTTMTTEHPGVWVTADTKISALGVHLRRNISSHGIALNVSTDLSWFDRIVACGLEGKRATSMEHEGVTGMTVGQVGFSFVEELASALHGVKQVETFQYIESY